MALLLLTAYDAGAQQLPSSTYSTPSVITNSLGYNIGDAFTPHHKITGFFQQLAAENSQRVKLESYGTTYEGRPLMVAYISSPANISRIEQIRQANLELVNGKRSSTNVTIVWLSYNVHGNEPSSSEAAMLTAAVLAEGKSRDVEKWLQNTLVVIDPCLNPDGRDRYVNWYNSTKGRKANIDPASREHAEPWPQGRTNHYNFDLNRDWAWQTQIETRQRIKLYNQWMPHIHVDYHEQFYDDPYYFAPAAEPFHKVITGWQRQLQTLIGKNHAAYFDKNNWLYFTREQFDLFYPGYGDTYPTYTGAVGMTYEQAGHSRAGLGVITAVKDTLTLTDRVAHHHTTALSTIEVASAQAEQTIREFAKFYEDSRSGINSIFKTYILTSASQGRISDVAALLKNNGIEYHFSGPVKGKGFNYFTGKEETITTERYTLVVDGQQNKSVLASVLLEPEAKLSDSLTYDVTAWSLPYAHGIKAYAVKEKVAPSTPPLRQPAVLDRSAYGYLMQWNSVADARVLSFLLQKGLKIRSVGREITVGGESYQPGALIILNNQRQNVIQVLQAAVDSLGANFGVLPSGFIEKGVDVGSPDVKLLKQPRVAMFTGTTVSATAAGEIWHYFDWELNYPLTQIDIDDFGLVDLTSYDVIILPHGQYEFLAQKSQAARIQEFLRGGGRLIALQGAASQLNNITTALAPPPAEKEGEKGKDDSADYGRLRKYADRQRTAVSNDISGAIYRLHLDNSHPLAFGFPDYYYTLKPGATVFSFLKTGWNVGYIKKDNHTAGFVGAGQKSRLKDGTLIGEIEEGRGSIIFFVDDPLFRGFWQSGKLLFTNAVFFTK